MPKLFCLEGIDCAGKTTVTNIVIQKLKEKYNVEYFHTPKSSKFGVDIFNIMNGHDVNNDTKVFGYISIFTCIEEEIKEILDKGYNVFLDRWILSLMAYQIQFMDKIEIKEYVLDILNSFIKLDHTFILSPKKAIIKNRLKTKDEDINDGAFENIYNYYSSIKKMDHTIIREDDLNSICNKIFDISLSLILHSD